MIDIATALRHACQPEADGLARADAELLMAHVLGKPRTWLYAFGDSALTAAQQAAFEGLAARRAAGEPVAYLTGRRGFWTLDLQVTPDTLIPRPETELLVELALARLPPDAAADVLDLGTGSGAVALAIASERPLVRVTAVDASPGALAVARANAETHGLRNLEFRHGDWYAPVADARFALIASNPPYIETTDPHLAQGDLRFEPYSALASGRDGLDDLRAIIAGAPRHLLPGGWLLLEHGWHQGAAVRALLADAGFAEISTERDLEQRDRVTMGRMS
ncbi:release factor glutamine methyltransferase [Arenimonas maotaiensis]|uniref:Release factor glutamine methyltransferase n=1 Tax=Arenimonas maotaiensis TaxID=1446479 RepID=A0A917FN10_9GAMM|nr:peptide chain release factor N(5)-glutamine methyltransferase [Arenimonas maotaiensis]GGF90826.1 release factor glutamine methyltransferase [Arenimonas maotaiensis]